MPSPRPGAITALLEQARQGHTPAVERLVPLVYRELRRLAVRSLRGERPGVTLQPTDLVHEAYLRLLKDERLSFENRAHFFGIAARAMRQILVERARARGAAKRGGARRRITLDERVAVADPPDVDLLALDEALERLAAIDARHAQIVELRFFGGLSNDEAAAALGVSPATVKRAWAVARAWLYREVSASVPGSRAPSARQPGVRARKRAAPRGGKPLPDFDRVSAIVAAALDLDPRERLAFVERECGAEADTRAEVESLLAAHAGAGNFLDRPAAVASGLVRADAPALSPGSSLGPYRVARELGRGGMGIVYLAEDTRLGRSVAVKVLAPEYAGDERRRGRLRLEARAAAALAHPGIATVFALEEVADRLCLVCEYVRGETLRDEVERGAAATPLLVDTGIQVARALAAAHAAGIIHRDLKPENVIRSESGLVKVLDFGVARFTPTATPGIDRLTDAGAIPGTPAYMSPEQLAGAEVDARSDIFALGVLLFELASRIHPFETATPASTAARVIAADPPRLCEINPRIPDALERVIARCLRKDPKERYQSASEVADDLEALRAAEMRGGVPRPSAAPAPSARRLAPTARGWWVLHHAAAMLVAAVMIWPSWLATAGSRAGWPTALLLAAVVAAAVNGTVRAHLLFTNAFNPGELKAQLLQAERWLRLSDWLFAGSLLAASLAAAAAARLVLAATLAAVSVGWMVTSLLIEPATRRAAFRGRSSGARRRA